MSARESLFVQRDKPTAEGLAIAFAACLRPGAHGTPVVIEQSANDDGSRASFVVTSKEGGETYLVTVEQL